MDENCDACGQRLHRDANGWWVGPDETSDCPKNPNGHTYEGEVR